MKKIALLFLVFLFSFSCVRDEQEPISKDEEPFQIEHLIPDTMLVYKYEEHKILIAKDGKSEKYKYVSESENEASDEESFLLAFFGLSFFLFILSFFNEIFT